MRLAHLGIKKPNRKKLSPENRKKLSDARKKYLKNGGTIWNKGLKGVMPVPWNKGKKGLQKGWSRGKKLPQLTGKNHWHWKGGITPENHKLRTSLEYRLWRKAVFERDKYQCIWGGKEHGNKLVADHIKPWSDYPELRFAIDNGRTLCVECHKKTETYGVH